MPSYLVTIRLSAETQGRATILAESIVAGECEAVRIGLVRTRLESVVEDTPPTEIIAGVRALSPAVLAVVRQMVHEAIRAEMSNHEAQHRIAADAGAKLLSAPLWSKLTQQLRADARDEAKLVVRDYVFATARRVIP